VSEFPVSRLDWAKEIISYWKQKTGELSDLKLKPFDRYDPHVQPSDVRHPEAVPQLMRIDPYWQLKEYRLALGDTAEETQRSASWQLHTKKFIDLQQNEIMKWIELHLTSD